MGDWQEPGTPEILEGLDGDLGSQLAGEPPREGDQLANPLHPLWEGTPPAGLGDGREVFQGTQAWAGGRRG